MKELFWEFMVILAYSKRTQWAVVLGLVSFLSFFVLEDYMVGNINLHSFPPILNDSIKEILVGKYHKAAFGSLFSFWFLAFKLYKRDKKRFYSHF
ncbi:MAG: hypothetical protein WDA72_01345 [Desulfomonilia bacterium]